MKKITLVLALLIILPILSGCAIKQAVTKKEIDNKLQTNIEIKNELNKTTSSTENLIENWKEYSNKEWGISLKYPGNWTLTENDSSGSTYKVIARIVNPLYSGKPDTDIPVEQFLIRTQETKCNGDKIIIDNRIGTDKTWSRGFGNFYYRELCFPGQDWPLTITLVAHDEPSEAIMDKILSTFIFTDQAHDNITCKENSKYFIVISEKNGKADFLIKTKSNSDSIIPCSYTVSQRDFEIKNQEATMFFALTDNFLILDTGTAPPPRVLTVYNLKTFKKVFTDQFYYENFVINNDIIKYWSPSTKKATIDNCPQLNEYLNSGLGAIIESYVTLNLDTLIKKELGEFKCTAVQ